MLEDAGRRVQSACILCRVHTQREVHPLLDSGFHDKAVGLSRFDMRQDVHWPQELQVGVVQFLGTNAVASLTLLPSR